MTENISLDNTETHTKEIEGGIEDSTEQLSEAPAAPATVVQPTEPTQELLKDNPPVVASKAPLPENSAPVNHNKRPLEPEENNGEMDDQSKKPKLEVQNEVSDKHLPFDDSVLVAPKPISAVETEEPMDLGSSNINQQTDNQSNENMAQGDEHGYSANEGAVSSSAINDAAQSQIQSGLLTGDALQKEQMKWCHQVLKSFKRNSSAEPFKMPVDPVALGIPTYFDIIKNPMDLTTIEKRLNTLVYNVADEFIADVRLMLNNCFTFNPPGHQIHIMGKNLEKSLENYMKKLPKEGDPVSSVNNRKSFVSHGSPPNIQRPKRDVHPPTDYAQIQQFEEGKKKKSRRFGDDMKFCRRIYDELMKKSYAQFMSAFYYPVDPVALGIPTYFDIVKHPMDLSTMRRKLEVGEYESADDFYADYELMVGNCLKFNPPGDPVHIMGIKARDLFHRKWNERSLAKAGRQSSLSGRKTSLYESDSEDSDYGMQMNSNMGSMPSTMHGHQDEYKAQQISIIKQQMKMLQQQLDMLEQQSVYGQSYAPKPKKVRKSTGGGRRQSKPYYDNGVSSSMPVNGSGAAAGGVGADSGIQSSMPPAHPSTQPGPAPEKKQRKKKEADEIREITFEEKKELSLAINDLSVDKLATVVRIIRESMPQLGGENNDDEIELDIDSLDLKTLNQLYNFVVGKKNKKNRKRPTEFDDSSKVREFQNELARIDGRPQINKVHTGVPVDSLSESSETDDSSGMSDTD